MNIGNASTSCTNIKVWSPQGNGDVSNPRQWISTSPTSESYNINDVKAFGCRTSGDYIDPNDFHFTIASFGQLSNTVNQHSKNLSVTLIITHTLTHTNTCFFLCFWWERIGKRFI
jgi:hypothetical protein